MATTSIDEAYNHKPLLFVFCVDADRKEGERKITHVEFSCNSRKTQRR